MKIIVIYGCSAVEIERGVVQAQSVARQISNFGHNATVIDASNITPIYQQLDVHENFQDCLLNEFWSILRDADVIVFAFRDNVSHVPDFMQQLLQRAVNRRSNENILPMTYKTRLNNHDDGIDYCGKHRNQDRDKVQRASSLSLSQQIRHAKLSNEKALNSPNSLKAVAKLLRLKQYQIWHYNGINYGLVTLNPDCRQAAMDLWKVLQSLESVYFTGVFRYGVPNLYKCDQSLETAGPCIG